jgi:hypothetical protein
MPAPLRAFLAAGAAAGWSTARELRFNVLPRGVAARLTVGVATAARDRWGAAAAVAAWAGGVWAEVLVDIGYNDFIL